MQLLRFKSDMVPILAAVLVLMCCGRTRGATIIVGSNTDSNSSSMGSTEQDSPANQMESASSRPTIGDLVEELTWVIAIGSQPQGVAFTGFDGKNIFTLPIEIMVSEILPDNIVLSKAALNELHELPEYKTAKTRESSKIGIEGIAAFVRKAKIVDLPKGRNFALETLKAGKTLVTVKYLNTSLSVNIDILAFTPEQVAIGKLRYNSAVTTGQTSLACATCHDAANGVDLSASKLSQFSDRALRNFIETGVNTDTGFKSSKPHEMSYTDAAQKDGIVAYLRSKN